MFAEREKSKCKHLDLEKVTPTARELAAGQTPVCDYLFDIQSPLPNLPFRHETITPHNRHFYVCKACLSVICKSCKEG